MAIRQIGATATSTLPSYSQICERLQANGWTREVADTYRDSKGAHKVNNFDRAVRAAVAALSVPKRGIIVSGDYGCGKTSFVKALTGFGKIPYLFDMNDRMARECLDPNGGYRDGYNELFRHSLIIDDLGAELRKQYGEADYSEARDFICEYFTRGKGRLFITTNLHLTELLDRYGGRFCDRLKEIGIPLPFEGGSKRTWEIVK